MADNVITTPSWVLGNQNKNGIPRNVRTRGSNNKEVSCYPVLNDKSLEKFEKSKVSVITVVIRGVSQGLKLKKESLE